MKSLLVAVVSFMLWLPAQAQVLKVLTAGALKPVVTAMVPVFRQRTGVDVDVQNDTAGNLLKRIQGGESFDVAVLTMQGIQTLAAAGRLEAGSGRALGRVGIGVAVKQGTPAPPMATVDDFRQAVLAARRVAWIDPAAGGSSGIYLQGLFQRLGIADAVLAKSILVPGGLTATRLVSGEADLAVQQASELMVVEGAQFVAMLPDSIQNWTVYGRGIAAGSRMADAAAVFVAALERPAAQEVMRLTAIQPVSEKP